jgi:hypothetical protein
MLTETLAVRPLDETQVDEAQERLAAPAPVLITEHEVALGTAVALRARPTARRRWVGAPQRLLAALNRGLAPSTQDVSRTRRNYPQHYGYLENACLARAMERL